MEHGKILSRLGDQRLPSFNAEQLKISLEHTITQKYLLVRC